MEQVPYDYTGFGPAGAGNSPTPGERRRAAMDQFYSSRAVESMRFLDPYIVRANEAIARARQASNPASSPDQVRRDIYGTKAGQAAQDAAWLARTSGFIGSGDPRTFAANNLQGLAAGGFGLDVRDGAYGNRTMGIAQRVTGNGMLTEQMAINFNRGVLRNLYGNAGANPRMTSGLDMAEMSEIVRTITSRGGVGTAGALVRNASFNQRLSSQIANAVDPTIADGLRRQDISLLSDLDAKGRRKGAAGEEGRRLQEEYLATLTDAKQRMETKALFRSNDALVFNQQTVKKVTDLAKEVAKGVASLSDIYTNLSAGDLQRTLESIAGKKIINETQAKQANNMVNQLRNAAIATGIDPGAFMQDVASFQLAATGRLGQAFGMDARTTAQARATAGNLSGEIKTRAQFLQRQSESRIARAAEFGIDLSGTAMNADDIAEDQLQGAEEFAQNNKAYVMALGMRDSMTTADRSRVDAALAEFDSANTPAQRAAARNKLQNILARGGNFSEFARSRTAKTAFALGTEGDNGARVLNTIERARAQGVNDTGLRNFASQSMADGGLGLSADAASRLARLTTQNVGVEGLVDLTAASKLQGEQERRQAQMDVLRKARLTDADAAFYLQSVTGADGRILSQLSGFTQQAGMSGYGNSAYEQSRVADAKLAMLSSQRDKFRGGDAEISLKSIANALLTDRTTNLETPEAKVMAIQAMLKEGASVMQGGVNMGDEIISGLDVSQGFTKEALAKINRMNGGDTGLLARLGMSESAFIDQSRTDSSLRQRALDFLTTRSNFSLSGPQTSLSGISKRGSDAFSGSDFNRRAAMLATARAIAPQLSETDQTTLSNSIMAGGTPDLGALFSADTYNARWFDGGVTTMRNADKMIDLAGQINAADAAGLKGIRDLDSGGVIAANLEKQRREIKKAMDDGINTIYTYDSKTGEGSNIKANELTLKALDEAIKKLQAASEEKPVTTMRVTNLHVENQSTP